MPVVCDVEVFNIEGFKIFEAKGAIGRIEWNGRNKAGEKVSPGVYYYIIKNDRETIQGKLFIIK